MGFAQQQYEIKFLSKIKNDSELDKLSDSLQVPILIVKDNIFILHSKCFERNAGGISNERNAGGNSNERNAGGNYNERSSGGSSNERNFSGSSNERIQVEVLT